MNRVFPAVLGAALVSISCAAAAELPDARRLHSIDVFQLEYADDVQISPDGGRIVYVRVSHDIMGFERYGDTSNDQDLWIDDVALSRQRVACPAGK